MITIYTYNGNVVKDSTTGKWFTKPSGPGPGPGPLPPIPANTVRVRTSDGNVPFKAMYTSYETATLVSGTTDVYDVYKSGTSFKNLLRESFNVVEVLGANTTGITDTSIMFDECTSLTSVPLFDTSSVTTMRTMFYGCTSLTSIPLFDTSNVDNMDSMFYNCSNVQSGALALYQQASTQTNPPSSHSQTFYNCGSNTTTGAAELAQIDGAWK